MNTANDEDISDENSDFDRGIKRLVKVYDQTGGLGMSNIYQIFNINNFFNKITPSRSTINRIIKGFIRGGSEFLGAGIAIDAMFAVHSSNRFINEMLETLTSFIGMERLFKKLFSIDLGNKIPLFAKINLSGGITLFEQKFDNIIIEYAAKYGKKSINKIHKNVIGILNNIVITVSDWIACLFPYTFGVASEISRFLLEYAIKNGYSYIYNLLAMIPGKYQKMITNKYALIKLIQDSIKSFRHLILNLSGEELLKIITSIGIKTSNITNNSIIKGSVKIGAQLTMTTAKALSPSKKNKNVSMGQKIIVHIIDNYIYPNVVSGVKLFNQLFPIFLMFVRFLEKYDEILK